MTVGDPHSTRGDGAYRRFTWFAPVIRTAVFGCVAVLLSWSLLIPDVYPRGDRGPLSVSRDAAIAFALVVAAWVSLEVRRMYQLGATKAWLIAAALTGTAVIGLGVALLYVVALALGVAPDRG